MADVNKMTCSASVFAGVSHHILDLVEVPLNIEPNKGFLQYYAFQSCKQSTDKPLENCASALLLKRK